MSRLSETINRLTLARVATEACRVYETSNYSIFKELEHNRDASQARVDKLVASFTEGEIINPIIINEHLQIIDGQGRYEALKILGRPIKFIVSVGANIDDCRRLNLYNTKWTATDFVKSYANAGNANYINILSCQKACKQPFRRILRLVNKANGNVDKTIREGNLIFTKSDIQSVDEILKKIAEIKEALAFGFRLNDAFYIASRIMFETKSYNHARMLKMCKQCRGSFCQMSNLENMLKEFSRVYNFKNDKQKKLYFEDYMRDKGANVRTYDVSEYKESPNAKTLGGGQNE